MPSTAVGAMWKSRPIVGSATFTIVMSMMFMNIADTNTVPTTTFWLMRGMTTNGFLSSASSGRSRTGGATSRHHARVPPVTLCGRRSSPRPGAPACRGASPTVSATLASQRPRDRRWRPCRARPDRRHRTPGGARRTCRARRRRGDLLVLASSSRCRPTAGASPRPSSVPRHGRCGSAAQASLAIPAPFPVPRQV